ncbi:MAG: response regulator, partial [Sorangiineae bacterium]|nr:response regulator [Sorangiineae bacterium]
MPDDRRTLVLVADDEPTMRTLVADRLRGQGFKVLEAADGDEAWQLAQESLPDLVVLDVMMPGMTGWEVCRKIRDAVSLAHTGVVMLTGIGERLNEMTSPLYGADAHIDKPFEFVDLEATIRETLAQRRGAPAHIGSGGETPRLEGKLRAVKSSDIRRAAARKKADGGPRRTAPKLREAPPTRNAPALTPASRKRRAKGKQLTLFDERPSAVSRAGTAPAQQPATGKSGKTPAKQTSAKKATAKKATAKKASAKKASAKKASAKKASA